MQHGTRGSRCAALLLAALLLCLPAEAAPYAGAEDFQRVHRSEFTADSRSYTTNGAPGYVTLRYEDLGQGAFRWDEQGEQEGWVAMEELLAGYDKEQFVRDHLDEFVMEPVVLDMRQYEEVFFWDYPGCGGTPGQAGWYARSEQDQLLRFPAYWVDSLGRRWGGYSFYEADGFICLDEPGLKENLLPEVQRPGAVIPAADGRTLPKALPAGKAAAGGVLLAAGAAAVFLGGAVWLAGRKRRGKKRRKRERRG